VRRARRDLRRGHAGAAVETVTGTKSIVPDRPLRPGAWHDAAIDPHGGRSMTKLDYLLKQYENLLGWYRQSEEKARFLVTINTLVVGVANGLVFVGADKVGAVRSLYVLPVWILLAGSGVALLASYVYILRALWPRHHAQIPATATPPLDERLWFFGDVATMSRQAYGDALDAWTDQRFETAIIAQNHILSKNVWIKHEALNRAILCTIVALVLFFCLGVAYGIAVTHMPLPVAR
jgi:hypothetical protein